MDRDDVTRPVASASVVSPQTVASREPNSCKRSVTLAQAFSQVTIESHGGDDRSFAAAHARPSNCKSDSMSGERAAVCAPAHIGEDPRASRVVRQLTNDGSVAATDDLNRHYGSSRCRFGKALSADRAAVRRNIARTLDDVRTARYERTLAPSSSRENSFVNRLRTSASGAPVRSRNELMARSCRTASFPGSKGAFIAAHRELRGDVEPGPSGGRCGDTQIASGIDLGALIQGLRTATRRRRSPP